MFVACHGKCGEKKTNVNTCYISHMVGSSFIGACKMCREWEMKIQYKSVHEYTSYFILFLFFSQNRKEKSGQCKACV